MENKNIEINRILDIVKSKKILIIFIIMLSTLLGYYYSYQYITPKYQSTSTLLLIPENTTITTSDLTLNSGLISTYSNIATNSKILNQVINHLGLDMTEEELQKKLKVSIKDDTYIIEISVTDSNPETAYILTSEIANVFLNEIKQIYHLNNIGIVDQAQLVKEPYNINHIKDFIIFFLLGVIVSTGVIFIFYFFDNTVKEEEDIEKYIKIKTLGSIPNDTNKKQEIIVKDHAKSYIAECINTIRTNILYMNSTKQAKTLLITSCVPGEGKSWTSSNIAVSFAMMNKKVLLVDADMRKGRANKIFKLDNQQGLSNYLYHMTGNLEQDIELGKNCIKETEIPNLHVLTNGTIPPNPSELIGSDNMKKLLQLFKNIYDVIIIDAPPCKPVTDSIILSTIVDSTILVINSNKTKVKDINEVVKSIKNVGGQIIGGILNKVKIKGKVYKKSYYYGHSKDIEKEEEPTVKTISIKEVLEQAKLNLSDIEETPLENIEISNIQEKDYDDIKLEALINQQNQNLVKITNMLSNVNTIKSDINQSVRKMIQNNNTAIQQDIKSGSELFTNNVHQLYEQMEHTRTATNQIVTQAIADNNLQIDEMIHSQTALLKDMIHQNNTLVLETVKNNNLQIMDKVNQNDEYLRKSIDNDKKEIQMLDHKNKIMEEFLNNYAAQTERTIKQNNDEIANTIQELKNQIKISNILIVQMIENNNKELKEQISNTYDAKQIKDINDTVEEIKNNYIKLLEEVKNSQLERTTKPIQTDTKGFETPINEMIFSIHEDIPYESLEKSAQYVIPFMKNSTTQKR